MTNDTSADLEPTQDDNEIVAERKNVELGGQKKVLNKRKTKYVVMT